MAKVFGGLKFINDCLHSVMTICCQFSTALQQGNYDPSSQTAGELTVKEPSVNPIEIRAQIWKAKTERERPKAIKHRIV